MIPIILFGHLFVLPNYLRQHVKQMYNFTSYYNKTRTLESEDNINIWQRFLVQRFSYPPIVT